MFFSGQAKPAVMFGFRYLGDIDVRLPMPLLFATGVAGRRGRCRLD
jgi:hypothetical protein